MPRSEIIINKYFIHIRIWGDQLEILEEMLSQSVTEASNGIFSAVFSVWRCWWWAWAAGGSLQHLDSPTWTGSSVPFSIVLPKHARLTGSSGCSKILYTFLQRLHRFQMCRRPMPEALTHLHTISEAGFRAMHWEIIVLFRTGGTTSVVHKVISSFNICLLCSMLFTLYTTTRDARYYRRGVSQY